MEPPDSKPNAETQPTGPASPAPAAAEAPVRAPAAEPPRIPITAIGASAGGLEALEALTGRLSADGMAFVVLQHIGGQSVLPEILARKTPLKVVTIEEGMRLEPSTIYVTPPNADIEIEEGVLRVRPPSSDLPRHSIDTLFRSLARDQGSWAIGVVLSGAGNDGTLGLRAIKEEGGITFVQEPSTAAQSSMPQSALDAQLADFCLSPAEIGDELMRIGAHPFVARKRPVRVFGEEVLADILGRLRRAFGVDFTAYKLSTIERRIERRMTLQKLDHAGDYLKLLDKSATELGVLYGDLLIGVTSFFRDREPFEALKSTIFPRLLEKRSADRPIRIWVPGCASGEEAYSIAICLFEYLGEKASGYKLQIFATDIDDHALDQARLAHYPESIELDVSAERLQRFFTREEKGYRVARPLRDVVVFAHHNVGKDPPFSRLDLVSCRNVLIYMQAPLQRKVLRAFHYALNPDASLLLGSSESVGDAADLFSVVDHRLKLYSKKGLHSATVLDFAFGAVRGDAEARGGGAPVAADHRPVTSMQQLADRKVIERYGPPGVLLNEALEVIQFRGQTGPFLAPAPGAATFNIYKLARSELLAELRVAITRASTESAAVSSSPVALWNGHETSVILDVMPLQDATSKRRCLLVSFRPTPTAPGPAAPAERLREPHQDELARELLTTKEYLETSIQELEGTNEELQSSNEELQSSNEELQSTNEELETSKEELQSTNEELATVNDELQSRMLELGLSNDDLQNIMGFTSSPVILVGMDQRIRRFSAAAERLLGLSPADLGRPVTFLGNTFKAPQLEQAVSDTINSAAGKDMRVRGTDGHWYTLRLTPYRTAEHSIRGAVLELVRSPAVRRVGEPVEVNELVGKVLSTLPHVLVLLDEQVRILWVNKKFFETFQVGAEALGLPLEEVWPRTEQPEVFSMLEATAAGGPPLTGLMVRHPFRRPAGGIMKLSARLLPAESDRPALTLMVLEEIPSEEVVRP